MNPNDWAKLIVFVTVFVLPVLAITIILTSRLALKPIVEAVLRLREGMDTPAARNAEGDGRLLGMEEDLRQLHTELAQLREEVEFQAQLRAPDPASPRVAAAGRSNLRLEPSAPRDTPPVENAGDYAQEYE